MSTLVRRLWTVAEPLHALTYFAEECHRAFEAAGLRGFWRGYFAGRAAPLGHPPAEVVTATFFGFHPDFVARAIPSVWSIVDPDTAIAARLAGVDSAIHRIIGSDFATSDTTAAVAELRRAIDGPSLAGRPLFAANVALEWPDAPGLQFWHAVTLLREHRGDGHVAALVVAGVDPCTAHVLRIADDGLPLSSIQPYRGWSEKDWSAAADRLRERGWLDGGRTTPSGSAARASIERDTDRLGAELVGRIAEPELVERVLESITRRIVASGVVPFPNPIGVPIASTRREAG